MMCRETPNCRVGPKRRARTVRAGVFVDDGDDGLGRFVAGCQKSTRASSQDNIVSQDEPDDFDASRYYYNRDDGGLSREGALGRAAKKKCARASSPPHATGGRV